MLRERTDLFLNPFVAEFLPVQARHRAHIPHIGAIEREAQLAFPLPDQRPDGTIAQRKRLVPYFGQIFKMKIMLLRRLGVDRRKRPHARQQDW